MSPDPDYVLESLRAALNLPGRPRDPNLPERAASVAVILHLAEARQGGPRRASMLWIRRAANPNDPWSGHMGYPGGHQEDHDDSPVATAHRETEEELGLDLDSHGEYLGPLTDLTVYNRTGPAPFRLSPHAFWVPELPELRPDPSEVAAAHSIDLPYLLDPGNATRKQITWQEKSLDFPGVRYQDAVIWGLSYRVMQDFFGRLARTDLGRDLGMDEADVAPPDARAGEREAEANARDGAKAQARGG